MKEQSKDFSPLAIVLLYLLPILSWIFFTFYSTPVQFSFVVALVGALILFFGASMLLTLFRSNKQIEIKEVPVLIKEESRPIIQENTSHELNQLKETLLKKDQELKDKILSFSKLQDENQHEKQMLDQLRKNEEDAYKKIEQLGIENHQKQQLVLQLENQIRDLRYEIKTLLQLTEIDYSGKGYKPYEMEPIEDFIPSIIQTTAGASHLLKRCIDIAEKMTSGYRSTHLRSLSTDPYAFDLRRLSDSLRLESGALIILYSPKEERLLYASVEVKDYLGVSPDKFIQEFASFAKEGVDLFNSAASKLIKVEELALDIAFYRQDESEVILKGALRPIKTGIFRSLLIGVFYQEQDSVS